MANWLGYNFSGPIAGDLIPQRVQNLCIRDYAQSKGMTLTFNVSEYFDDSRSLMLMAQLEHLPKLGGFIFYSYMQLPADPKRRAEFCKAILQNGKAVHFALENLHFDSKQTLEQIESMYRIGNDPRLERNQRDLLALGRSSQTTNRQMEFFTGLHTRTKRNYIARVTEHSKAECAKVAKQWAFDYWDGERQYGYGGYRYDGRWAKVAQQIIDVYGLTAHSRILDVGCGKGFLLYEIKKLLPGAYVRGIDISSYAIENSKEEIRPSLMVGDARSLPYVNGEFDLVYSINTLHNFYVFDLFKALREIQRVTSRSAYICAESYRSEEEKANLLYWQLTCETFFTPDEWKWAFQQAQYSGDYEFIYFE